MNKIAEPGSITCGYEDLLPLETTYRELLSRHKAVGRRIDWTYHEFLPIEQLAAPPNREPLSDLAYGAVEIAAVTEANLPWYTSFIVSNLPREAESLLQFVELWTAEEDQHSLLLESYLLVTNNGDHRKRAKIRRQTLEAGFDLGFRGSFAVAVYTAIQELQTRVFYLRAASLVEGEDRTLARAFRRLAKDETLHMDFYRDVVRAHLRADPNFVIVVQDVLERFVMPGTSQPDYRQRAAALETKVLDHRIYSRDVIEFICRDWAIDALKPTSERARLALRRLRLWRRCLVRVSRRSETARSESRL